MSANSITATHVCRARAGGGLPSSGAHIARLSLQATTQRVICSANHKQHLTPSFQPGHCIWLANKDLPLQIESKKLAPQYVRPCKILRRINPVAYHLALPCSVRLNPTFYVSCLKPGFCSPMAALVQPVSPLAHIIDRAPAFTVICILDSYHVHTQNLVDWEGYGSKDCS